MQVMNIAYSHMHGNGTGAGTGNGTGTIGNNGPWSLPLSQTKHFYMVLYFLYPY